MSIKLDPTTLIGFHALEPSNLSSEEPFQPDHFCYMSGIRGDFFRMLVERGILDPFGKITAAYANTALPPLAPEELALIITELQREFEITLDNSHKMCVSMDGILRAFLFNTAQWRPDIYVRTIRLIGGYVSFLLFSKTNYAKRVFKALKIDDLYDENLFQKHEKGPVDIDLRMRMEKHPYSTGHALYCDQEWSRYDFEYLRDLVTWQLSYWFVDQQRKTKEQEPFPYLVAQTKIYSQAFEELCTIDRGFIQMQLLSFKQSPVDWILFHRLPRDCVFTVDDLYLPLNFLIDPAAEIPISPESHRGQPLESFFHYVLGFTDAENITTIDEKGWFRYLSWIMKGNCTIYMPKRDLDIHLEPYLFSKVDSVWIQQDPFRVWKIQAEFEKWIKKHHPDDSLAALILTLNMCLHLRGRLSDTEIQGILNLQLSKTQFKEEEAFPILIKKLVKEQKAPLQTVACVMKLAAFQVHARRSPTLKNIHVETRTDAFIRPVTHLRIDSHTLQLDLQINEALRHMEAVPPEFHHNLAKLFFLICPPSGEQKEYSRTFLDAIGIPLESFSDSALALVENAHPFPRYLGLAALFSHPTLEPAIKREFAERNFLSILELVEDKESLRQEFIHFIGPDSIPPLSDARFTDKWIRILFEYGRGSEQIAFDNWKELPPSSASFALIEELAYRQPGFALRLFTRIKLEDFPNEAFACILACGGIVEKLSVKRQEHENLIDFMESKIPELLDHKRHKMPQTARLLSSTLNWYVQRSGSAVIARAGLKRGYFLKSQKQACLRLTLLTDLTEACGDMAASFSQVKMLLKDPATRNLLTKEEQLKYILALYEADSEDYDPDIFSLLINLGGSSAPKGIQRVRIVELIFAMLETQPFKPMQRFVPGVERVVKNLESTIPFSCARILCVQCYLRKIDLPKSLSAYWYESLHSWCMEESPDYPMIYNLVLDAKKRGFDCSEASIEVKLVLAEKWVNYSEFSERSFELMKDLIRYLPEKVDKRRFYRLFATFIFYRKSESLNLLDQIALRDSYPLHALFLDSVFSLCFELQAKKGKQAEVLIWLNKTRFFDLLDDRNKFQELIQIVVSESLDYAMHVSGKIDWARLLYTLASRYPEDMKSLDVKIWSPFILFMEQEDACLFVDWYRLVDEHRMLKKEDPAFFRLYVAALRVMVEQKDPRLSKVLENAEEHIKLCSGEESPEFPLFAHTYFIEAASRLATDLEMLVRPIQEIYALGRKNLSCLKANTTTSKESNFLDRIESSMDFDYVLFFYRIDWISEGRKRLGEILSQAHSPQYWNGAGNLINALVSLDNPLLLEEIDTLLELTEEISFPGLDAKKTVPFLLKNPSKERYIYASRILRSAIGRKVWAPGNEAWSFICQTMCAFLEAKEHRYALQLAVFINLYYLEFQKAIGESFQLQALEICLLHWSHAVDPKDASFLLAHVNTGILCLPEAGAKEERERILSAIFLGLAGLARLQSSSFSDQVDAFLNSVIVRTAQTKRLKNMLVLPANACFSIKRRLIETLIAEFKPSHPFAKIVDQKIKDSLNHVMRDPAFREKKEEITSLLKAYQTAIAG